MHDAFGFRSAAGHDGFSLAAQLSEQRKQKVHLNMSEARHPLLTLTSLNKRIEMTLSKW